MRAAGILLALAIPLAANAQRPTETIYLELWQPAAETAEPPAEVPRMLIAVGQPTMTAPIAAWCEQLRLHPSPSALPDALLRHAPYDRFATELVPLLLEILIDDIEMRYALGTERPQGASGLAFPFFELCPLGFGRRENDDWALDVLHLSNHRGDEIAVGLYKGALPETERTHLEAQLGYPAELADPAGVLLLGQGKEIDMLLLVESPASTAFDKLRRRIVR